MTALDLADVGAGFADAPHDAQRVFRAVLEAMSRPGRLQRVAADVLTPLQAPAMLGGALCSTLLALLDTDTRLHLAGGLQHAQAQRYLGFHTGVRWADAADADFVACVAADAAPGLWQCLRDGSDEMPQAGATLVVEVPSLAVDGIGQALTLSGPGIEHTQHLMVAGLPRAFWQARVEREADFPRGIDLLLTCGHTLAALPRSTHITLEG